MASCAFSSSLFFACDPFAVGIRPSGEGVVGRVGDGGFSSEPFLVSVGFQLMLVDLRLIEDEVRGSALLRRWW